MPQTQPISTFADFRFDSTRLRLMRRDQPVSISGLPLRILEILLASGGRVVTRAEFKQSLWPYAARIDTERRLNTAMRALREALGDSGGEPRFIETLRGRGYRWIAGESVAPPGQPPWRLTPFVLAFLLVIGGSSARLAAAPSPEQQASLVRLAATADRRAALAGVENLIRENPGFADAQLFRAKLAVEEWRDNPDPRHFEAASAVVAEAARAVGGGAALDTLSAELALGGRWDWAGAEQLYRSALHDDPGNEAARRGLAWLLVNSGRAQQAWSEIGRLMSLSRLTGESRADLGWLLLRMGRPDLAEPVCRVGEAPANLLACRHTALARLGSLDAARQAAIAFMQAVAADESAVTEVSRGGAMAGYRRFLDWRVTNLFRAQGHWFQRAQLQAAAGHHMAALDDLDRAFAERDPLLVKLASTPEFAPLSRSPRFRSILAAVRPRSA